MNIFGFEEVVDIFWSHHKTGLVLDHFYIF